MLSTLGKICNRQHFEIFFPTYPKKQDLTFQAISGDNLARNFKSCFLGLIRKYYVTSFILFFPESRLLTFHANCLPGDNLHEKSKAYFLGKISKISVCHQSHEGQYLFQPNLYSLS